MQENIIGGTITYKLVADPSELYEGIDKAKEKIEDAASQTDDFRKAAERSFGSAASAAFSFASDVVNAVGAALDSINSLGNSVVNTFEKISGINMPTADMSYATDALSIGNEMAAKIEGASMGMTLMTKDATRTDKIMNSVITDAKRTTFNVANLLGYTQQIGAAAKGDYEGAEKAALGFGGAMVAAGNGLRDMGLVVRNVQQGMARGYNSIDLRQFKTYIPQFTQIMEQAGLTDEKIIKMGVDGAKAVNQAIANWVEAENIWEKYEYTYTNLKESLNESLQTTAMDAYTKSGLFDAIKNAMVVIKDNLPILEKGLTNIAKTIADVVNKIDWKAYMQAVAAGLESLANILMTVAGWIMKIIKFVGNGDLATGIRRIIPLLTTLTVVWKGFRSVLNIGSQFGNIIGGFGKLKDSVGSFGGVVGKVAGVKGGNSRIAKLTELAIAIAAFAGAIWLVQKAMPGTGAEVAELLVKLGILASVIVSMELITRLATKLKIRAAQIKNMTLMAGELALFAAALWVVNKAVPDDIGGLAAKLGMIAAAISGIGVIAGVLGIGVINQAVNKGLLTVVGIAGTLALVGLALRSAYSNIPDDFGGMQLRIGSLALVIVEIGVLAGIIGALMSTGIIAAFVITGLVTIIGIAGALALAGVALKAAYDVLPSDFAGMQAKIGGFALVITEIAGLATAMGLLQVFSLGTLSLGLLTLVEISAALALSAKGIKVAADNMPENMDAVSEKIHAGVDFLVKMKDEYGGSGGLLPAIGSFFWNGEGTQQFDTFVAISSKLAEVAVNLSTLTERMPDGTKLSAVLVSVQGAVKFLMDLKKEYSEPGGLLPTLGGFIWNGDSTKNFDIVNDIAKKLAELANNLENLSSTSVGKLSRVVNGNLFPILKQAVDVLKKEFGSEEGGLLHSIGSFFHNEDSTEKLDKATKIAETLGQLVDNLAKIQDVRVGKLQIAINQTIPKLKEVVEKLKNEFTSEGGFFHSFGSFFSNGDSTEMLDKANEIASTLGGMTENLTKIQDLDLKKLSNLASDDAGINPIIKLKDVVSKLKSTFVDDADSVTNKLKEYDVSGLEVAQKVADNIKKISDTLSGITNLKPDVPGINSFIEKMKEIVAKIVEQFGPESGLGTLDQDTADSINNVSSVVKNISEMNENVNGLKPVNFEEVQKRIAEIKKVIEEIIHVFCSDSEDRVWGLTENFSDSLISDAVGYVLTTINGMISIGNAVQNVPKVPDDAMAKINKIRDLIRDVVYAMDASGEDAIHLTSASVIVESMSDVLSVIQSLKDAANTVKDFPDAGKGAEFLKTFTTKLAESIKNLPNTMEVETLYVDISKIGENIVDKLLEGFTNKVSTSVDKIREPVRLIYETMQEELVGNDEASHWYETAEGIILDLVEGIYSSINEGTSLQEAADAVYMVLEQALIGNEDLATWYQIGQKIVSDMALGLADVNAMEMLMSAVDAVYMTLESTLGGGDEEGGANWSAIGQKIVVDLANGMLLVEDILDATAYQLYQTLSECIIADGAWGEIGMDIVRDMANGMLSSEELLYVTIEQLVFTTFDILTADGAWYEIGMDIVGNISNGVIAQKNILITQIRNIYQEIIRTLDQGEKYSSLGRAFSDAVASGINNAMYKIRNAMDTLNGILRNISTNGAFNAGANIAAGVAQGIMYNMWRINWAMGNLSSAAINTLKRLLDIHSPSRVMFRLGEYTGEGLARGLLSTENDVSKAALRTGRAIYETAYFSYKNVGVNAGQGLVDGLNSMAEKVAESARRLATTINTEMETINPVTYTGGPADTGTTGTVNKTNNITLNNNIYNELDLSAAMSELQWEVARS